MRRRDRGVPTKVYLDFSELEVHSILMEDLRKYVGSPKTFIPKIWGVCMSVLREEGRIIINERDNSETLDDVWNDFYDDFDSEKFRRLAMDGELHIRQDDYRDRVTFFYYDVFEIMYPQVAAFVDKRMRNTIDGGEHRDFTVEHVSSQYTSFYDGFSNSDVLVGAEVTVKEINYITTRTLTRSGYRR